MSEDVRATSPAAPWIGGKRNLARRIVPIIDADGHTTYAEPFVGMGGIFFRRTRRPKAEVINDASREVANLFRILQRHYPQFIDCMRYQITSRAEFERLSKVDQSTLTDLERAARFLYLQRTAFGGKIEGRSFGVSPGTSARFNLVQIVPLLEDLHARLAAVIIECLDFERFLDRYDRPTTLFYLDPPYWGSETVYGKGLFERADFERLAAALASVKGRFLMSINDNESVRKTFARFQFLPIKTTYTLPAKTTAPSNELLISNFL